MLDDVIYQSEQLPIDEISSPNNANFFEFYDHGLFPENLQHSEVSSCSNCCYEENSSYTTNLSFNSSLSGNFSNNNNNVNINSNTAIDFSPSPTFSVPPFLATQQEEFDFSSLQLQSPLTDIGNGFSSYSLDPVVPLGGLPLPSVFEEDCLSPMPSYVRMNPSSPSCSFLDPTIGPPYLPGSLSTKLSTETSGIFGGSSLLGSELQPQELEFQGDNGGIYGAEWMQQIYNARDIQAFGNGNQQLDDGGSSKHLASEISNLEESTYKVGRLSVEERKEKIHKYMKKKNERNFSKKIKYACRKTLADSRPRVRGRFAKNDEFGETSRTNCNNHEDDDNEYITMKDGEDMVDSSDIFSHISGVNSFKCNHPIPSWI